MNNIVYCISTENKNEKCFLDLVASVKSLVLSSDKTLKYTVYILFDELSEKQMEVFGKLKVPHIEFIFQPVSKELVDTIKPLMSEQQFRQYSTATCWRLFLAEILPQVDKCVYLDNDTLVMGDIATFCNYDLQGKTFGMIRTITQFECGYNAGSILIDLSKIREDADWKNKLLEHAKQYMKIYSMPDQTLINQYYRDSILELPEKFNHLPRPTTELFDGIIVVHFYNYHQKAHIFTEYDRLNMVYNNLLR